MASETAIGAEVEVRLRRPSTVAVLSLATFGLYSIVWYYKVNREMRDFGSRHGDRKLGSTKPWASVLGLTIGGIVSVPRLISLVRTIRRIQAVERIAMGTPRPARALTAGVVAATLLPLGAWARPIGLLFVLASIFALVLSITVIQARLNAAWRAGAATVSHNTDAGSLGATRPCARACNDHAGGGRSV